MKTNKKTGRIQRLHPMVKITSLQFLNFSWYTILVPSKGTVLLLLSWSPSVTIIMPCSSVIQDPSKGLFHPPLSLSPLSRCWPCPPPLPNYIPLLWIPLVCTYLLVWWYSPLSSSVNDLYQVLHPVFYHPYLLFNFYGFVFIHEGNEIWSIKRLSRISVLNATLDFSFKKHNFGPSFGLTFRSLAPKQ